MRRVELADLQGNVLCGYGRKYAHGLFLFVRIEERSDFARWLRARIGGITTALRWEQEPRSTLNVALTSAGLREMGVPRGVLDTFPEDFREGMEARCPGLGDTGDSEPGRWDERLKGLHGVLTVLAQERSVRDERREQLEAEARDAGLHVACAQETDVRPDEREPFGFVDGISQPQIDDPDAGPHGRPGDVHVKPGEFVLGYLDEGGVVSPTPAQIGVNGSYMVVRKLDQDPDAFWDFVRAESAAQGVRPEWLAAKLVGRWPDGTPLVQSPNAPGGSPVEHEPLNDFGYARDPDGVRCPIGAHIRRTNPRDSLDPEWRFTNRHRIIRRGMPYWQDDGKPGLIFVCYQASIERQFEFVQAEWMGNGNAFGLGSDPDFLAGPSTGKMTIQGSPPRFVPMRRFITTRGGDYFFVPGIAALERLTSPEPAVAA